MPVILEVKNYVKKFHMHILNNKIINALDDISFCMNEGEIIGLTGRSGSGKSTLMKSVYRTYLATGGEILYNSILYGAIDLLKASDHQIIELRKKEITYCSQFLSVIPRVSAIDVVGNGLLVKGFSQNEARELSKAILAKLDLSKELWDAYPSTFSGGEQQRINVAQAIIRQPRLLLIDEPTASLDQKTKDVVINMILELKSKGTSVLCISHDSYTLSRMCDRLIELREGRLVTSSPQADQDEMNHGIMVNHSYK
jgi:alpha-D-ribose 1-methylphosphonate 5-triphosphate synthase subunit PhnL